MPEDISEVRDNIGTNALYKSGQRYITKDEYIAQLKDKTNFNKFEPLFNYFDKRDNQQLVNDNKIDLATFADMEYYEMAKNKGDSTLSPFGYIDLFYCRINYDSGLDEERVAKVCQETGVSRNDIIEFLKDLFKIQKNGSDMVVNDNYEINRFFENNHLKQEIYENRNTNIQVEIQYDNNHNPKIIKNGEVVYEHKDSKTFSLKHLPKKIKKDIDVYPLLQKIFSHS